MKILAFGCKDYLRPRGGWLAEGDVGGELLEVYEAALAERGLR